MSVFVKPPVPSFSGEVHRISWSKWYWHDVVPEWNFEGYEGTPLEVEVYCGYELVELFLNGKSLGKKETNRNTQWVAQWLVPYESGELKAVAYNGDEEKAVNILKTALKPELITLVPDKQKLIANGQDLSFVTVTVTDKDGTINPKAENLIHFSVDGPAEIIAVANSNPMSVESFQANERKAWKGKALVIVKTEKNKPGQITLTAESDGLKNASINLISK